MADFLHVLITGGVGSRLWPLSRRSSPKQYLELFSGKSLFELAVKRNRPFSKGIVVVGNLENAALSEMVLKKMKIRRSQHIQEAVGRNTAAAIAFAALSNHPEETLLVTPADHIIKEGKEYDEALQEAVALAEENHLVTFGITPHKPETGYGYIEYSGNQVLSFHEKPAREKAEDFLKRGNFLWNSGMFCFKAGVFLEELLNHQPEVYWKSIQAWEKAKDGILEYSSSLAIPSISVDHAVMEKSQRIKVVKSEFQWSDMGSFEAIYDYLKESGHSIDTNNNMHIGDVKPTYFVGVNNCILISTKDANLIVDKGASQEVKTIYQYLAENRPELI